jgi:TonB family protein
MAVAGGEVFLQLTVSDTGVVTRVETLRATPPFTDIVFNTVRAWRFRPAERRRDRAGRRLTDPEQGALEPVESKVLVAAVYRPPSLHTPTVGEAPRDVATAADDVPFPRETTIPPFPPLAQFDGVVLLEVAVSAEGSVTGAASVESAPGFDEAALSAAKQWTFRPARVDGRLENSYVYLVMGFRQPVTLARPPVPPTRPPQRR